MSCNLWKATCGVVKRLQTISNSLDHKRDAATSLFSWVLSRISLESRHCAKPCLCFDVFLLGHVHSKKNIGLQNGQQLRQAAERSLLARRGQEGGECSRTGVCQG